MEGAPLRNEDSEARPSLRAKRWRGEALRRRPPLLGWALRRLCLRRLCPARRIPNEARNRRKDRRRRVSTSPKASSTEGRAGGSAGGAGHRLPSAASDGGEAAVARLKTGGCKRRRRSRRRAAECEGKTTKRSAAKYFTKGSHELRDPLPAATGRSRCGAAPRASPTRRFASRPGLSCRSSLRRGPFAQAENRT